MSELFFPGRVGVQQRLLPAYRASFFDTLAGACRTGLSVFAGRSLPEESVLETDRLQAARFVPATNLNFFPVQSPIYHCWQRGLVAWLEVWQPDVLVVEASPRCASSRLAVRWMHRHGRPAIGWGLGDPQPAARSRLGKLLLPLRRLERLTFLKSLDALIAYSQNGAAEYRALGFPPERVAVAPNAAVAPPSKAPPPRPDGFEGRPVVLFVGRLQARKRVENLLKACAMLPDALQPLVQVVGDGPALPDLQTIAEKEYPLVEFAGAKQGKELDKYFNQADLFVLPGTGGLAVQQAMAYALPVVVAEGDGTQNDWIRPGTEDKPGPGWLVPPNDLPALRSAIESALSNPGLLRRMGAEAFRTVAEDVNIHIMADVFIQMFHQLVDEKRTHSKSEYLRREKG